MLVSEQGNHRRPEAEPRPQPQRPEFTVEPLRTREEAPRPSLAYRLNVASWVAVTVVFLAIAGVLALEYDAVRSALETSVQEQDSGASSAEVTDTVTVTLLGSAGVAAVILVLAGVGSMLAAGRKRGGALVLGFAALAAIGASLLFWSFMSEAGSIAAGALQWGPLLAAGLAVVAAVTGFAIRR